jgi:hypothetical protein
LKNVEVIDFRCLKNYSHKATRCWSVDRWAIVGEAGSFVDPLYSPGTDFIAFANCFTAELLRGDHVGEDLEPRVREFNFHYRALVMGGVDLFRDAAKVYGHGAAMSAKIYWDNFAYWSFACQYFLQEIYRLTGPEHSAFTEVGARFVELSTFVQKIVGAWVELAPEDSPTPGFIGLPRFPSLGLDAHLDLQKRMTPADTLEYIQMRQMQGDEMVAEILIRVLVELGPKKGQELLKRTNVAIWDLSFPWKRIAGDDSEMSVIARDAEASLGPRPRHAKWKEALALLQGAHTVRPN